MPYQIKGIEKMEKCLTYNLYETPSKEFSYKICYGAYYLIVGEKFSNKEFATKQAIRDYESLKNSIKDYESLENALKNNIFEIYNQ